MKLQREPARLTKGNWLPHNWKKLNDLIGRNAVQGRYACFDFDDTTSIHGVDCMQFFARCICCATPWGRSALPR